LTIVLLILMDECLIVRSSPRFSFYIIHLLPHRDNSVYFLLKVDSFSPCNQLKFEDLQF
jgi:hypothetical protein